MARTVIALYSRHAALALRLLAEPQRPYRVRVLVPDAAADEAQLLAAGGAELIECGAAPWAAARGAQLLLSAQEAADPPSGWQPDALDGQRWPAALARLLRDGPEALQAWREVD
jgi:hypothetical protein